MQDGNPLKAEAEDSDDNLLQIDDSFEDEENEDGDSSPKVKK